MAAVTHSFNIMSDCHSGGPQDTQAAAGQEMGYRSPGRKHYEKNRLLRAMMRIHGDADFTVHEGDRAHGDNDGNGSGPVANSTIISRWVGAEFVENPLGMLLKLVSGNHDGPVGYEQAQDRDSFEALFAQLLIARKLIRPNPRHDTYPEGGENEGTPTTSNSLSWLPEADTPFSQTPASGSSSSGLYDADWRTANILDADGLVGSPLENFWAMEHGGCLHVFLDVNYCADPGDQTESFTDFPTIGAHNGGEHSRPNKPWRLGPYQQAWLATVFAASTAQWKFVHLHNIAGVEIGITGISDSTDPDYGDDSEPGRFYGRGSGISDEALLGIFAAAGVTAIFKGHDHRFCHVARAAYGGLNIFTAPSTAPNLSSGDDELAGWHWRNIANSYGTAETGHLGAGNILDFDGNAMTTDLKYMNLSMGYINVAVTATEVTVSYVATSPTRGNATLDSRTYNWLERYPGTLVETATTTTTQVAYTLTTHADEAIVIDPAGVTGDWWNGPPSNLFTLVQPEYPSEQMLVPAGGIITLTHSAIAGGDAYVRLFPEVLYTVEIAENPVYSPPSPGAGGGGGMYQMRRGRPLRRER